MKSLLSLFDHSTVICQPFVDNGWDVVNWDLKDGRNVMYLKNVETTLDMFPNIDGVIGFPPCTDFTVSGSQYWTKKDAAGITKRSLRLVHQMLKIVDLYYPTDQDYDGTFFWVLENPVGRLQNLVPEIGKPYYFDPCDFAGWMNLTASDHNELDRIRMKDGNNVTSEEAEFVIRCNAYTKKTGLWGSFNKEMVKKRVEPVRCCKQGSPLQRLGGKSDKTKELRSNTPEGFARAFYHANNAWRPQTWTSAYGI